LAAYLLPGIPRVSWVIIFALMTAGINLARTKSIAIFSTVLVCLSGAIVAIYILVCAITVSRAQGSLISTQPFGSTAGGADFSMLVGGAGLACMAFLGFDAISVFSGDASQPKKRIGRAMLISVIVFGIVFLLQVYFSMLASPGIANLGDADNAILMAGIKIGGPPMVALYLVAMLISTIAVAIVAQAAAIRMLRAFGETGMLPKAIFAQRRKTFSARCINPLIVFVILTIAALMLPRANQLFGVMRYGGLLCFVLVNITVIWHFYFRRKGETADSGRRRAGNVISGLVLPALGFFVCFYLWLGVGGAAFSFGTIWMCAGALVLALTVLVKARRCRVFSRMRAISASEKAQTSRQERAQGMVFQFFESSIKHPIVLLKRKIWDKLPFSPMTGLLPTVSQQKGDEQAAKPSAQGSRAEIRAEAVAQPAETVQGLTPMPKKGQNGKKPTRKPARKRTRQYSGQSAKPGLDAAPKASENAPKQDAATPKKDQGAPEQSAKPGPATPPKASQSTPKQDAATPKKDQSVPEQSAKPGSDAAPKAEPNQSKQFEAPSSSKQSAQQKQPSKKRPAPEKQKTANGSVSKPSVERRRNPRSKKTPPGQIELPLPDETSPKNQAPGQIDGNNHDEQKE
jgi:amino acid transporter